MSLVQFLFVGLVAGWLMGRVRRGKGYGLIGNLFVGAIGSLVGKFVFSFLNMSPDNLAMSVLMAFIGAAVFLVAWDALPSWRLPRAKKEKD